MCHREVTLIKHKLKNTEKCINTKKLAEKPIKKHRKVGINMKFMNNHYGESRVFGHARFKTMPEEVETGGGAFSGESEKDSSAEEGSEVELSTDELVQQLAAERANSAKLKANLDKTLKEKGEITKKYRSTLSANEQEAIAKKEAEEAKDARIAELEAKMQVNEYTERCMDAKIGMSKDVAKSFAEALTNGDSEKAFEALANHIGSIKTKLEQEFYAQRPELQAGHGDGKESLAVQKAKELAKKSAGGVNVEALKQFM